MPRIDLTAVGITCGIGSMLYGARQAGFRVVGNVEWRRYYHARDAEGRNTFEENFDPAFMLKSLDDLSDEQLEAATGCCLAMGHPECGAYSQMQGCNNFRDPETRRVRPTDAGDIPLYTSMVARLRPRFFAMDDLPKSLLAYPMSEYAKALPDYDLFPEWVSNWHYGNIQRSRRRLFMIGARRDERWVFVPGESEHTRTLMDVIGDLPVLPRAGEIPNHDPHDEDSECIRGLHMDRPWHRPTWGDMRRWFERADEGESFRYYSPHAGDGETKVKPGWYKQRWSGHCAVLDGGSGHMHPRRNLPFTIRERARIQGFADDFIFYGTRLDDRGQWVHEKNIDMLKQTGKAMPIQFCRYVAEQVRAAALGRSFGSSGLRLIAPNPLVDEAKRWYCQNVGYADQQAACSACWLRPTCDRHGSSGRGVRAEVLGVRPRGEPRVRRMRVARAKVPVVQVDTRIIRFDRPRVRPPVNGVPGVHVDEGVVPRDYHCRCRFCKNAIGELRPEDGTYYNRNERRTYYDPKESGESGHAAKTPLHVARWAVQRYTRPGQWVLDPTIGAGTTGVEALVQRRNAAGMELQFGGILSANLRRHAVSGRSAVVGIGDARNISEFLHGIGQRFPLIVNNPPYSGDEHWTTFGVADEKRAVGQWSTQFDVYDRSLPNLALLKEGDEYWRTMEKIYRDCVEYLYPGGRFVVAVKDQMRAKRSDQLHERFAELLEGIGLEHEGTAFLRHHPGTLHLHTYFKRYGVHPPYYQTIIVFRRPRR